MDKKTKQVESQSQKFVKAAREGSASEDQADFDRALSEIARVASKATNAKKTKRKKGK